MSQPQLRQLPNSPNQPDDHPLDSSFLSSQITHKTFPFSNKTTATKPNTNCSLYSSFASKLCSTSHQHLDQSCITKSVSSCFNVSSRVLGGLRFGCGRVSSMATQGGLMVQSPSHNTRNKKLSGQGKRQELEKEVLTLQKMLNQEEKVNEILEHVHKQNNGPAISIPNFLPPKMKELLAELAMVEGEIARLESQINQLQTDLKQEQNVTNESKSKQQWRNGNSPNAAVNLNQISRSTVPEKIAFETKALHFISKAIKGDYTLHDFRLKEKMGNFRTFPSQKENQFHEESKIIQDRVPRKSGLLLKPSSPLRDPRYLSPLRDPRYSSPKPKDRINPGQPSELPPRSLPNPVQSEDNIQNWQPNRLSENIMKCLNFIYVRLLRTSRAMELEKSGHISRSMQSLLSSRSFRVENGVNSSLVLQKESRQQDPYGIFNMEESIPRDIGPYKNLVIFMANSMDPKSLSSASSLSLLRRLRILIDNLQTVDLRSLSYQQKLAFWINMYNACIMHGFLQHGVHSSPEKLLTLMNKATINIGGNIINAQAIEHYILRQPASSNIHQEAYYKDENYHKEATIRQLYGLSSVDPNVTFALCCGTRSSPAVRIYTAESVEAELEKSKLEYLQASIMVKNTKRIAIPEVLVRNMSDFALDMNSLVEWVCHQLPTSGSLRKSIVDCFKGHNNKIAPTVEKLPYDFEFQYLLAI